MLLIVNFTIDCNFVVRFWQWFDGSLFRCLVDAWRESGGWMAIIRGSLIGFRLDYRLVPCTVTIGNTQMSKLSRNDNCTGFACALYWC